MEISQINTLEDQAELRKELEDVLKHCSIYHAVGKEKSLSLNHGYKVRKELGNNQFEIQFLVRKDKRFQVEMINMARFDLMNDEDLQWLEDKKSEVEYIFKAPNWYLLVNSLGDQARISEMSSYSKKSTEASVISQASPMTNSSAIKAQPQFSQSMNKTGEKFFMTSKAQMPTPSKEIFEEPAVRVRVIEAPSQTPVKKGKSRQLIDFIALKNKVCNKCSKPIDYGFQDFCQNCLDVILTKESEEGIGYDDDFSDMSSQYSEQSSQQPQATSELVASKVDQKNSSVTYIQMKDVKEENNLLSFKSNAVIDSLMQIFASLPELKKPFKAECQSLINSNIPVKEINTITEAHEILCNALNFKKQSQLLRQNQELCICLKKCQGPINQIHSESYSFSDFNEARSLLPNESLQEQAGMFPILWLASTIKKNSTCINRLKGSSKTGPHRTTTYRMLKSNYPDCLSLNFYYNDTEKPSDITNFLLSIPNTFKTSDPNTLFNGPTNSENCTYAFRGMIVAVPEEHSVSRFVTIVRRIWDERELLPKKGSVRPGTATSRPGTATGRPQTASQRPGTAVAREAPPNEFVLLDDVSLYKCEKGWQSVIQWVCETGSRPVMLFFEKIDSMKAFDFSTAQIKLDYSARSALNKVAKLADQNYAKLKEQSAKSVVNSKIQEYEEKKQEQKEEEDEDFCFVKAKKK